MSRCLAFYISGHGFGHAVRDIEVINAVLARDPDVRVAVRSSVPRWLFDLTVRGRVEYVEGDTDTGIVQHGSLHLDERASVEQARAFLHRLPEHVEREVSWLRAIGASMVVADLPPLGIAAGTAAGLTTVAFGNFTWDWIYAAYPNSSDVVGAIVEAYAGADFAVRLPMHGGFASFEKIVDVPLVARRSRRDPVETRRALGLPLHERLVLASFGGHGLDGFDLDALAQLDGYVVVMTGTTPLADLPGAISHGRRGSVCPLNERAMYAAGYRYEDVVRAVEVVVTKPGYGIISECAANDTALLYTSRGHFVEYDVLVEAMPGLVRSAFIDHEDLFAGRWGPVLNRLMAQPTPPPPPVDGAERTAAILLNAASSL